MEVVDAIYKRRAVRKYTAAPVSKSDVNSLIQAAIHAPSALNAQPWAFAVVQNPGLLKEYSDQVKAKLLQTPDDPVTQRAIKHGATAPDHNVFYDAGTVILICARTPGGFSEGDCCLAAQNLMLAACAAGLATCPIGFAISWLRLPETKAKLGIPESYQPVLPIIVGYPETVPEPTKRAEPEILFWK